ncbi:MAG TPA: leucine-rich repeat domain-containing protein, partial [Candidatus Goldiibacteriota bacterium]|nr:leucine-rich repeat domain-containing protein [Candidatus Goldiibacteriota bacterium]
MKKSTVLVFLSVIAVVSWNGCKGKDIPSEPAVPTATPTATFFADQKLEAKVREAIGKSEGEITASDLIGLTDLNAGFLNIFSLEGIQYCADLTFLSIAFNNVLSISPLAGLTGLESLNLALNNISDIGPLAGLLNLKYLYLSGNEVSDISSLS